MFDVGACQGAHALKSSTAGASLRTHISFRLFAAAVRGLIPPSLPFATIDRSLTPRRMFPSPATTTTWPPGQEETRLMAGHHRWTLPRLNA